MPTQQMGAPASRIQFVVFWSGERIERDALARAIGGGIKRAGLAGAGRQTRDEIVSTVHEKLARYLAGPTRIRGSVGSLAFKIAYRVAIDMYRRPARYDACRSTLDSDAVTPAVEIEPPATTAEARMIGLETCSARLTAIRHAVARLSASDRAALLDMLTRKAALPRDTPLERRVANATAQREKRARDRLRKALDQAKAVRS